MIFVQSDRSAGTLLMLASAFLFSVLDGLIKLMGPGFRIWDIAFYRFGFGLVILIAILGWNGNPFSAHNLKLMIIRGITGTTAFLFLIVAIRLIPISTAMVLFFSFPAFAALFSFLLFNEQISISQIGCVLSTLVGAAPLLPRTRCRRGRPTQARRLARRRDPRRLRPGRPRPLRQ